MHYKNYYISCLIFVILVSCGRNNSDSQNFSPKPKGYNRIDLPKIGYQKMTEKHPYNFVQNPIGFILIIQNLMLMCSLLTSQLMVIWLACKI
jgi:hypothetical protein